MKPVAEQAFADLQRISQIAHAIRRLASQQRPPLWAIRSPVCLGRTRDDSRARVWPVVAYDPYADKSFAATHDVRLCSFEELLAVSDAVSRHALHRGNGRHHQSPHVAHETHLC
jgi:hypothetical protein